MTCVCRYPQRPEEGIRFPGAGVMGECELLGVSMWNQTQVLWKNSKSSEPVTKPVTFKVICVYDRKNSSLVLKQNYYKIFSNIHTFFCCHIFLSGRTLNYFEFSSGIKIRVTFKRFLRKCHINIAIIHRHSVNPLLYSFGAPLGSC